MNAVQRARRLIPWRGPVDRARSSEPEIALAGIGRKFQKPTVFEQHTVFVNLELAMTGGKSVWHTLRARITPAQLARIDEVQNNARVQEVYLGE